MATITSTITGPWSQGATWIGGVAPTGVDAVVIAVGDVVTKDTAKGAPDCTTLLVVGTLACSTNGVKASGAIDGTGAVTIGALGELEAAGGITLGNTLDWTLAGTDNSNRAKLTRSGTGSAYIYVTSSSFQWADIDGTGTGGNGFLWNDIIPATVIEDTLLHGSRFGVWVRGPYRFSLRRCHVYDNTEAGIFAEQSSIVSLFDSVFGKDFGGTPDTNVVDLKVSGAGDVFFVDAHNCEFASATYITWSPEGGSSVRSQAHQQVIGDWRIDTKFGAALRSTASKKTGDFGIEIIPNSGLDADDPYIVDIPIPAVSGDSVVPSIWVQNATADLNLQDAANRMVFELDPGDEWGLNEIIDANTLADVYLNWRQVSFTGGTAGGTAKKGSVILRVYLKRYVASAVVYLADMSF